MRAFPGESSSMAKRHSPPAPEVPLSLWRDLYAAAARLQTLAPWQWMHDDHVLGISNEHGVRLVTVMGSLGEVFGVASYRGSSGANFLLRLLRGEFPPEDTDCGYYQDAVLMDLVPVKELRPPDRVVVDQIGFQPVAGKPKRFPKFTRYEPGFVPWFINEREAHCLLDDLRKTVLFAELLRADAAFCASHRENEVPFFPEAPSEPLTLAQFEWHTIAPVPPPADPPVDLEPAGLPAMLALRPAPRAVWEVAAFYSHLPISEGQRPYWPKMALVVDAANGMVLAFQLGSPGRTMAEAAAAAIRKSVQATGVRPAAIRVDSVNLLNALQPFARALQVKLDHAKALPMLSEARQSLEAFRG